MLKLALVAALSIAVRATNRVSPKPGSKHHTAKRLTLKSTKAIELANGAAADKHGRTVRRVAMVHGKRRVVLPNHPPRGAGRRRVERRRNRGLEQASAIRSTLRSNVAYVIDQSNSEVLFEKNSTVALPIASITKLMTGLLVVQAQQNLDEVLTVTDADVDHLKFTSSRLPVGTPA